MDAHWLVPVGMPTRHVAHASLGEFKDTINHLFVIKLLLIVRYKFGYRVPNMGMLNQTTKLPRHIVFMLDSDFTSITGGYRVTEKAIAWLVGNLMINLAKRKKELHPNTFHDTEPKVLFMKPTPKPKAYDELRGGKFQ